MSKKDWIILLIPIISNGVIIFLFQMWMQKKLDKSRIVEERKKEVVNTYFQLLYDTSETVAEVEKRFRLREEMSEINKEFKSNISRLYRYGLISEYIIKDTDSIEKIRAKSGFCLTLLNEYNSCDNPAFDYPLDEQNQILEYLLEIKKLLRESIGKTVKL